MDGETKKLRVAWYRCPVSRDDLSRLNQRSDFLGFLQTGGYLGLLALTGTATVLLAGRIPWPIIVLLVLFQGMCWNFMINGFHELVHDSVFRTQWLNALFLRVFSFLGWYSHHHFWASHTEHHKYTLHPPADLEVVLPQQHYLKDFWKFAIIQPVSIWWSIKFHWRHAMGMLEGEWEHHLFGDAPEKRRLLRRWSWIVLLGHGAIIVGSLVLGWWLGEYRLWLVPLVTSLAPMFGKGLHYLCNSSQHIGLRDNVPDFRLCCRTIYLNPFFQFLYWHMNYHTEHHMYAAVPCYKLGRLHRLIKDQMPECPRGLYATWKQIAEIAERQKQDPTYQYEPALPPRKEREKAAAAESSPAGAAQSEETPVQVGG